MLRAGLEAACALTLAFIVWLLTENVLASAAIIIFEVIARGFILAIDARGEPPKSLFDEAKESGGGI